MEFQITNLKLLGNMKNQQTINHLNRIAHQFGKRIRFGENGTNFFSSQEINFVFARFNYEKQRGLI